MGTSPAGLNASMWAFVYAFVSVCVSACVCVLHSGGVCPY